MEKRMNIIPFLLRKTGDCGKSRTKLLNKVQIYVQKSSRGVWKNSTVEFH